ncbi:MAG: GNAT family N-acetyltransferase [Ardenticatenaceae bacterium]|nr:GNAT family N-acetyltransferase [Ardenticatenaceae bacterium]MCB9443928.1 GNAT family N-acetyltransferase [Ardenticatenaceae bacterium]
MNIVDLRKTDADWQNDILARYPFQPYWWVRQVTRQSQQNLMRRQLEKIAADETAVVLGAYNHQPELAGFAAMAPLAWDTEHFGLNVWRVSHLGVWAKPQQRETACALAQKLIREARQREAATLHIWASLNDINAIHALEEVGFRTMEAQVFWLFDLQRQPIPEQITTATFRPHQAADVETLVALARQVYTPIPNRFHADPHLPKAACDELYAKWLRNSCSGEVADYISVIEVDGKVVGYGTLRFLDDQDGLCNVRMGQFMLGAIDPAFRQKGLHDDLLRSMLVWLKEQQTDVAFVGTQTNNAAAQSGMARMGWRPVSGGLSLHVWLA